MSFRMFSYFCQLIAKSFLKPIYTITLNILDKYDYGLYRYEIIKKSRVILNDGQILWK